MELRVFALAHAAPRCGSRGGLRSTTAMTAVLRTIAAPGLGGAGVLQFCDR
jgi:hypothetical protein